MRIQNEYLFSILFLAAAFALLTFPRLGAAEEGCAAAQCHAAMLKSSHVHPVVDSCETCHQAVITPHPQKKKKTFRLVQNEPALCTQCHPPFGTMQYVHSPVKNGLCTTCHDPHGSQEAGLLRKPVKDLCLSCHEDKGGKKFVHGPVATGDCTACHNPHEAKARALLLKNGAELCFTCHADMEGELKKKTVHQALSGGCTSCHDPHGSSFGKLLSAEGDKLCFSCHSGIAEQLQKAKSIHAPLKSGKGCVSCHAPHASDNAKLLPKNGAEFCRGCHAGTVLKEQTVLHGPLKEGKCTPCHSPHSSLNVRLLTYDYSSDFYISYADKEYQLCFACHNRDLLRFASTSYATGFRDGNSNLHFIHVNRKDRGKNCKTCHLVHASDQQKLIARKVPFGKWSLPIGFTKTENGGSCAPGCHKKYSYDRKSRNKTQEQKTQDSKRESAK